MKRPLALFLAFFVLSPAIFVALGLWRVGWSWATLPGWYWGAALLFGLLCLVSLYLISGTKPHLPYGTRMLRLGAAWGLPFTCYILSADGLQGELTTTNLGSTLPIRIVLALMITLVYGAVAASLQQRKTA